MSPEDQQRHIERVQDLSRSGGPLDKDGPHSTKNNPEWFRANGIARAARRQVHARMMQEVRAQSPRALQEARALVLAGPPGAGKGRVAETVLGSQRSHYANVDADEFKKLLLREAIADGSYESFIRPPEISDLEAVGERFYPLELAALVHVESSELAAALREDLIASQTNLVIDTVLGHRESAMRIGDQLAEAGYAVTVVDVEVPFEVSQDRIRSRWQEAMAEAEAGNADALGGRWVPSTFARPLFETSHGRAVSQDVAERLAVTCPNVMRYERHFTSANEHQVSIRENRSAEPTREVVRVRTKIGGPLVSPSTVARGRSIAAAPERDAPGIGNSRRGPSSPRRPGDLEK